METKFLELNKTERKNFIDDLVIQRNYDGALCYLCVSSLLDNLDTAKAMVNKANLGWLTDANIMTRCRFDRNNTHLIGPKQMDENISIAISDDSFDCPRLDLPKHHFYYEITLGLNPTDALRDKFEKMYGVRPRFHRTMVTFKMGGRVFAPKLIKIIYDLYDCDYECDCDYDCDCHLNC